LEQTFLAGLIRHDPNINQTLNPRGYFAECSARSAFVTPFSQAARDKNRLKGDDGAMQKRGSKQASQLGDFTPEPFLLAGENRENRDATEIRSPFDGHLLASVSQASLVDADEACAAAEKAFATTRALTSGQRAAICNGVADRLSGEHADIARGIALEAGKPLADAVKEVNRSIHTFRIAAEEAKRISGSVQPLDWTPTGSEDRGHRTSFSRRFPIGAILGITPFNFPLNLVAHKVAPAIAAGCPIIIKPAPQTPLTALRLGRMVVEAGWPAGAISVLPCSNEVAAALVADPRPRTLSFTGSAAVGWQLKAQAGKKRVTLELGGNAAVLVHDDADLDLAADRIVAGGFTYAGQSCISVQRVFVQKLRWQTLAQKIVDAVEQLQLGDPLLEETRVGPMISEAAAERAELWISEAVADGARLLTGGDRTGSLLQPTVLARATPNSRVNTEEVFAPLVVINPYETFEDGLAMINASRYGLQAAVFTRDFARIMQAWRELEVGAVIVNESTAWRADQMPYGGVKDSGMGREGLRSAIEEMTEERLLIADI
jgi:glyceraldehyde-3-phosphate dehydrogenase (NADP+)